MQTVGTATTEALTWIRAGFNRVRSEPARWLGMAVVYLAIALLLRLITINFLYKAVLALPSTFMLASAMIAARAPIGANPTNARGWLYALTIGAARELFQVFRREEHGFLIVLVSIVTLGLIMLVDTPVLLITGGSVISGLSGPALAGPMTLTAMLGIMLAVVLYVMLAMALLYLVPLTLFGNRHAIPAVMESFQTCIRYRKPIAIFLTPYVVVNLLIVLVFNTSHWLGYLLLSVIGLVMLPTFIIGLQRSYQSLFEAPVPVVSTPPTNPVTL